MVEKAVLAAQERVEWGGGQAGSRQSREEVVTGIRAKAGSSLDEGGGGIEKGGR